MDRLSSTLHIPDAPATNGRVFSPDLGPPHRRPRWLLAGIATLVTLAIVASVIVVRSRSGSVAYTTAAVQSGSLAQTVTASGTLNPQNTISVGTQDSGTITEIDVDFNSHVRKGQVLAKLDPTTFQAALNQAEAQLAQTKAQAQASSATASGGSSSVAQANAQALAQVAAAKAAQATASATQQAIASALATVTKDQSALTLAQETLSRDRSLLAEGYIPQSQEDMDQTNLVAAQTTLDAAKVTLRQAQSQAAASQAQAAQAAAQEQAQAAQTSVATATAANQNATRDASIAAVGVQQAQIETAKANLAHTIVTSPVDGTVISRQVSIGQTVAATLQTPTLFSIAQDLSKMELDLSVGESDIGHVAAGEHVSFTVLAYPNRTFQGTVQQVRQDAITTNNVVTYTTVVFVDNKDAALRPGMTANATITVAHVDNATIVPLAALAYRPPAGSVARPPRRNALRNAANAGAKPTSPWGATSASSGSAVTSGSTAVLFVLRSGKLVPVPVRVGLVTDTQATVSPLRGILSANDQIVTADNRARASTRGISSSNPLTQRTRGFGGPAGGGPQGGP